MKNFLDFPGNPSYQDKLKNPRWQKKRLEIFERDGWKCTICGNSEHELHIHHTKYTTRNPWDEPDKNLITVCLSCHKDCHKPDINTQDDKYPEIPAEEIAERVLFNLIWSGRVDIKKFIDASFEMEDFHFVKMREFIEIINFLQKEKAGMTSAELLLSAKEKCHVSLFDFDNDFYDFDYEQCQIIFRDCVFRLKNRRLIKKLKLLEMEIKSRPHDDQKVMNLLREYSAIKKNLYGNKN